MSAGSEWPVFFNGGEDEVMDWLREHNVERIRAEYSDFNSISRGKAVALAQFEHVMQHGLAFAATIFAVDIRADVVPGTDYEIGRAHV